MKQRIISFCLPLLCAAALFSGINPSLAEESPSAKHKLSGPYNEQNLSIYLVHGPSLMDTSNVLTLDEGIEKKLVVVNETGSVNQLTVENTSADKSIFLQAGDVVKGGKQDRVLGHDLFLKPKSGAVAIDSYCVENGRWTKRGSEDTRTFNSSKNRVASKALKLAAQEMNDQGRVWAEVSEVQTKLGKKLNRSVRSEQSASSLQLTLEDRDVQAGAAKYEQALARLLSDKEDAIGYVFAINGQINSGDIYPSHDLFVRLWPKLLNASAMEAFAEYDPQAAPAVLAAEKVRDFIENSSKGRTEEKVLGHSNIQRKVDRPDAVYFDERIGPNGSTSIHKNLIAK